MFMNFVDELELNDDRKKTSFESIFDVTRFSNETIQ